MGAFGSRGWEINGFDSRKSIVSKITKHQCCLQKYEWNNAKLRGVLQRTQAWDCLSPSARAKLSQQPH